MATHAKPTLNKIRGGKESKRCKGDKASSDPEEGRTYGIGHLNRGEPHHDF